MPLVFSAHTARPVDDLDVIAAMEAIQAIHTDASVLACFGVTTESIPVFSETLRGKDALIPIPTVVMVLPDGETIMQLDLFGGAVPTAQFQKSRRRK